MKKKDVIAIEKEIEEKNVMPDEIKQKFFKFTFENFILCIIITTFFLYCIIGARMSTAIYLNHTYKIASFLILILSIIILEIGYKKDNGYIALNSLEILFLAATILFMPYKLNVGSELQRKSITIIGFYIIIYYFIKAIIVYKYEKKIAIKTNNDIKDIIEKNDKDLIKEEKEKRIKKINSTKKRGRPRKESNPK